MQFVNALSRAHRQRMLACVSNLHGSVQFRCTGARPQGLVGGHPGRSRREIPQHFAWRATLPPLNAQHIMQTVDSASSGGRRKKQRIETPLTLMRQALVQATRQNSWADAWQAYQSAKKQDIKLTADVYNSLLFMCSGGEEWEALCARGQEAGETGPHNGDGVPSCETRLEVGQSLFSEMEALFGTPSEMCFTALARLAAMAGDGKRALALGEELVSQGVPPKLRNFTPALHAFAAHRQASEALGLFTRLQALSLSLTEDDYRLIIRAACGSPLWASMQDVFLAMGEELTVLQPGTLEVVEAYFEALSSQAEGPGPFTISRQTVRADGQDDSGGEPIQAVKLSSAERDTFIKGIANLARRSQREPNKFEQFDAWLEERGSPEIIIDAANVGFYGQNAGAGMFCFPQMKTMVEHLGTVFPGKKPLVVLSAGRAQRIQKLDPALRTFFAKLEEQGSFFVTPFGSNDDWYWMYAAVRAGEVGVLVSNDEMRDHTFQLLAPRYFEKWKQRHQVRYQIYNTLVTLQLPAPYTACIQHLPDGAWVFPLSVTRWLRAQPACVGPPTGTLPPGQAEFGADPALQPQL
ncbi:PRORP1 [Auxenochlorella protothecoides x Auxenochlorella symbiontica]